jgi:hypothetical protein
VPIAPILLSWKEGEIGNMNSLNPIAAEWCFFAVIVQLKLPRMARFEFLKQERGF